jgi:hypothetical protein
LAPLVAAGAGVAVAFVLAVTVLAIPNDTPTPTVTATVYVPVPGHTRPARPAPTVTVTRTAQPVSRATDRAPLTGDTSWAAGRWGRFPVSIQQAALCVAKHESWHEHNGRRLWTALNLAGSSASGFAQWLDGTWRIHAQRAGTGTQYARAVYAPAHVQAAVFAANWPTSKGAWAGTGCS